jgi:hypothetical protein
MAKITIGRLPNATPEYDRTQPITDDTATPPTASTTALVKSILVSEDSNNDDTITITITRDNVSGDPVFSVFKEKAVTAKNTVELLTQPLVLQEGDEVKATAGTANRLHVLLSVLEIT